MYWRDRKVECGTEKRALSMKKGTTVESKGIERSY